MAETCRYEARLAAEKDGLYLRPTTLDGVDLLDREAACGAATAGPWLVFHIANLLGRLGYVPAGMEESAPSHYLKLLRGDAPLGLTAAGKHARRDICCVISWETSGDGGIVIKDITCREGRC